jgi:hypothetical protein
MDGFEVTDATVVPPTLDTRAPARPQTIQLSPAKQPCDDVRQLVVVVWARTKLLERQLTSQVGGDSPVLTGLTEIGAAIAGITARLDELEDALARQAA